MSLILLLLACNVFVDPYVPAARNCDTRTAFYGDADADGAGDPLVVYIGCEAPEGYVAAGTDCDDADAAVQSGCNDTAALGDTSSGGD